MNLINVNGQQQLSDRTEITAKNNILYNGPVYFQPHIFAEGISWFFEKPFQKATVYKCDRQFDSIDLNYNLVDQQLVILYVSKQNEHLPIELNSSLVDSFSVGNRFFVNSNLIMFSPQFKFFLRINQGKFKLYAGFKKQFINRYNQNNQHGYISNLERTLFLYQDDKLIEIKSNRTLLQLIPEYRNEIEKYLKNNRINLKKSDEFTLGLLMDYINSIGKSR